MNDIQLVVNETIISGSDILSAIDAVLVHLEETGDLQVAENAIKSLMGIEKISGMGVARLLNGVNKWWDKTNQSELTGDTFNDWAFGVSTDFGRLYLQRCVSIARYQEDGVFSERIMARPIKDQQAIASHLEQGYDLDEDEWEELEDATHNSEVGEILRRAKGKPARKNTLEIVLDRRGTLTVWYQDVAYHGGYLKPPDQADSEDERIALEKMINRLVKGTGVRQQ